MIRYGSSMYTESKLSGGNRFQGAPKKEYK